MVFDKMVFDKMVFDKIGRWWNNAAQNGFCQNYKLMKWWFTTLEEFEMMVGIMAIWWNYNWQNGGWQKWQIDGTVVDEIGRGWNGGWQNGTWWQNGELKTWWLVGWYLMA
jgi:hypothetical protein